MSQLPDEDSLLSHRLDEASDDLACLQFVYRQNFWVLHRLGLLWIQPGRVKSHVVIRNSSEKALNSSDKLRNPMKLAHTLMDVETTATCHFHSQEGNT